MVKKNVDVIFDRKKRAAQKGVGEVEVRVYLSRNARRYIKVCNASPDEWEKVASKKETQELVRTCEQVIAAMNVLKEDMTVENFNRYYFGEDKSEESEQVSEDNSKKSFITFMELQLAEEKLCDGTRKHKQFAINAVKDFGRLNTYGDLTPANIMAFDKWLHNGERSDVTCMGYHKKVHKWVRQLFQLEQIPRDPYKSVSIRSGKSKEREPLLESELKLIRDAPITGKLEKVRDLFIFSAYTGLSYCDNQLFDFQTMAVEVDGMFYIDGSRLKTGTKYFTPILAPAMEVLKKYDYKLPHISNQKANDYLHVIQEKCNIQKSITFHVARHSFATLALAHDVPIENVARMLGHQNIATTQIYAKILHSTIERHAVALQASII